MATAADREPIQEQRKGWLLPLLALLALALLALLLWALTRDGGGDDGGKKVGETADGKALTVEELTSDDATDYVGETVTITEEIDDVINESSFTFGGDSDQLNLPVVGVTNEMFVDSEPVIEPQLRARIEGEVVEFKQDEFAEQYGEEFADDQYGEFEGKVALVASSIDIDPADDGGKGEDNGGK